MVTYVFINSLAFLFIALLFSKEREKKYQFPTRYFTAVTGTWAMIGFITIILWEKS